MTISAIAKLYAAYVAVAHPARANTCIRRQVGIVRSFIAVGLIVRQQ